MVDLALVTIELRDGFPVDVLVPARFAGDAATLDAYRRACCEREQATGEFSRQAERLRARPKRLSPSTTTRPSAALLSAPGAAALMGISVDALRKRVQRGDLPRGAVVYTGRRYQFRRDRLI